MISTNYGITASIFEEGLPWHSNMEGPWSSFGNAFVFLSGNIYKSNGNAWDKAGEDIFDDFNFSICKNINGCNEKLLFVGLETSISSKAVLYSSSDNGESWYGNLGTGLPEINYLDFDATIQGNNVYVIGSEKFGVNTHIWKNNFVSALTDKADINIDSKSILISPNPANNIAEVCIKHSLPIEGQLSVCDLMGNIVWSCFIDEKSSIKVPTYSFLNGIYVITLRAEVGIILSNKLLVHH
ncbi:MAG: T9SS type A sorting domain-containing protein [Saprospiraceae bacterium]|nr:T9SS type A sorting domain-containing protein [Saprospiraceae bacterium]